MDKKGEIEMIDTHIIITPYSFPFLTTKMTYPPWRGIAVRKGARRKWGGREAEGSFSILTGKAGIRRQNL